VSFRGGVAQNQNKLISLTRLTSELFVRGARKQEGPRSLSPTPKKRLGFHLEQCREFSYEQLKVTGTTGSPVGKMSRERLIEIYGAAEKSQGSPAARLFFKNLWAKFSKAKATAISIWHM
jgi:hypothetical protein